MPWRDSTALIPTCRKPVEEGWSLISLQLKEKSKLAPNLKYSIVSLTPVLLGSICGSMFIIKNDIRPH